MACEASQCDVMISLNVKSSLDLANRLKAFLTKRNVKVWLCTEMDVGDDFREEIVDAVDSCGAFICLMNEAWAKSNECKYEFNLAQRQMLTQDRPQIVPILLPDLDWNGTKHVRLCLANTNGIMYDDDREAQVFTKILTSLQKLNIGTEISDDDSGEITSVDSKALAQKIGEIDTKKLQDNRITGDKFNRLTNHQLKTMYGFSVSQIELINIALKRKSVDPYEGVWELQGETVNNYDGNRTPSNNFKILLKTGGISSTGLVWGTGTLHSNYSNVSCVWQGTYDDEGACEFKAVYSNNTHEECTGNLDLSNNTLCGDYSWFCGSRRSYGKFYYTMVRSKDKSISVEE